MATWFGGTSSDNKYEVGKSYSNSQGGTSTANADGSFTNDKTGRNSVGSSQSNVEWSTDQSDGQMGGFTTDGGKYVPGPLIAGYGAGVEVVNPGSGGSGSGSSQVTSGGAAAGGSGPGSAGVVTTPRGGSLMVGTAAAVQRGPKQRTLFPDEVSASRLDQWQLAPITPMMIGGHQVTHDRAWSDAGMAEERWGEGELLSPTWFYQWGVVGADAATWADAGVKGWANDPATKEWAEEFDKGVVDFFSW